MNDNKINTWDISCVTPDNMFIPTPIKQYIFGPHDKWYMKIIPGDRIYFNREQFPNMSEDEFSLKVIELLEKNFKLEFHSLIQDEYAQRKKNESKMH